MYILAVNLNESIKMNVHVWQGIEVVVVTGRFLCLDEREAGRETGKSISGLISVCEPK